MKRILIVILALSLTALSAKGQTVERFEIESHYSLVHTNNYGLMGIAKVNGGVHLTPNWALNIEYGTGASAINTYNQFSLVGGNVTYYFINNNSTLKLGVVCKVGGGLLWDRQADGSDLRKGFFSFGGGPRIYRNHFFIGTSIFGIYTNDLRIFGCCNGLTAGITF